MKVLFVFLLSVAAVLGTKTRLVGGHEATDGQFPYMVSVKHETSFHLCGGSILDETTILTSASSIKYYSPNEIVVGTNSRNTGGDSYAISKTISHENFNSTNLHDDIAIIKLANSIEFNDKVQPIKLGQSFIGDNEDCAIMGWGSVTFPGIMLHNLHYVDLKTYDLEMCKQYHSHSGVTDKQVCVFSGVDKGACLGDSGGPLVDANGEQIGIASSVSICQFDVPDRYTRVYAYLDWIEANRN